MSVTVLIPTISPGAWLDLAVESALDADVDVRIMVIFDGSRPDPHASWISSTRVTTHSLANRGGLAAALNAGLQLIDTPYVARLDADDLAQKGRFSRQRSYLDAHPTALLVSSAATCIDESGNAIGRIGPPGGAATDDVRASLLLRNYIIHPAVMYRRQAILDAGGYDESLAYMEDYELWLRLALQGALAMTADELTQYRLHPSQMTKSAPPFGHHVKRIRQAKRRLGVALRQPRFKVLALDAAWVASQIRRYVAARMRKGLQRSG